MGCLVTLTFNIDPGEVLCPAILGKTRVCVQESFRGRTSQEHPTIASQRTPENVYVGGEPNDDFLTLSLGYLWYGQEHGEMGCDTGLSIPPRCIENTF